MTYQTDDSYFSKLYEKHYGAKQKRLPILDQPNRSMITIPSPFKNISKYPSGAIKESEVQIRVQEAFGGTREVETICGFIDVLVDTPEPLLIEVKNTDGWKSGIGQLLAYGIDYPNHRKVLLLFNPKARLLNDREYRENLSKVCDHCNISCWLYSRNGELSSLT
jgi:hypothetical protein